MKNPIYQQVFQPKNSQQPSQPPQPPNQQQFQKNIFQIYIDNLLKQSNYSQFIQLIQNFNQPQIKQLIQQCYLKQQLQQQAATKAKESEPKSRSKKGKSNKGNDDFNLKSFSDNSKKNPKPFAPASQTMY